MPRRHLLLFFCLDTKEPKDQGCGDLLAKNHFSNLNCTNLWRWGCLVLSGFWLATPLRTVCSF